MSFENAGQERTPRQDDLLDPQARGKVRIVNPLVILRLTRLMLCNQRPRIAHETLRIRNHDVSESPRVLRRADYVSAVSAGTVACA